MIIKVLLPFLMFTTLFAVDESLKENMEFKMEAGIFLPTLSGDISNTITNTNFADSLAFKNSSASYLSFESRLNYDYSPNFFISYFNIQDHSDTTLPEDITLAGADYTAGIDITSTVDYDSVNIVAYQDFLLKGGSRALFGRYYPGDIEFDIGINVKYINWQYSIKDKTNLLRSDSWIKVYQFIPLPYFAFKYYRYNIMINGDISAISIERAKVTSAQITFDYRLVKGVYASMGYLYESFEVVEKSDTVVFNSSGTKLSFKYKF